VSILQAERCVSTIGLLVMRTGAKEVHRRQQSSVDSRGYSWRHCRTVGPVSSTPSLGDRLPAAQARRPRRSVVDC
jgi:hypothetical protein